MLVSAWQVVASCLLLAPLAAGCAERAAPDRAPDLAFEPDAAPEDMGDAGEAMWSSLFIKPEAPTLEVGARMRLGLAGRAQPWEPAQDWTGPTSWVVDDAAVARVEGGELVALAPGATLLMATAAGRVATAQVHVRPVAPARLEVTPPRLLLASQGSARLEIRGFDAAGREVALGDVAWRSEERGVAQVDEAGAISALAPGTTRIVASVGGVEASALVEVRRVARIEVEPASAEVAVGGQLQLGVSFWSERDERLPTPAPEVTWTNHTPALADLTGDQKLIALEPGEARISAAYLGLRDEVVVAQQLKFTSLSCAGACCGEAATGLYCWGEQESALLGVGPRVERGVPARVLTDERFTSVSVNGYVCGLRTDGVAYCWGDNTSGNLGVGDLYVRYRPTQVQGEHRFERVVSGHGTTCALELGTRHLYCWGTDPVGLPWGIDPETYPDQRLVLSPQRISDDRFDDLALASALCARREVDGRWLCMGRNERGQTGTGMVTLPRDIFGSAALVSLTPLASTTPLHSVVFGRDAACALDGMGYVWCWGNTWDAQLGREVNAVADPTPQRTGWDNRYVSLVATSLGTFCGTTHDHRLECWGTNLNGTLGLGATHEDGSKLNASFAPVEIVGLPDDWASAAASNSAVCVLTAGGEVWCWGCSRAVSLAEQPEGCSPTPRRVPSFIPATPRP